MAAASVALDSSCDVFLCHEGEQNRTFMDCLHRILLCAGGANRNRQAASLKVFVDPRALETGTSKTPRPVMEHEARNCRIGGHLYPPRSPTPWLRTTLQVHCFTQQLPVTVSLRVCRTTVPHQLWS
jgi:hypothetical protein